MSEQESAVPAAEVKPLHPEQALPVETLEAIVVSDHVVGPPGPSEWRAMREQALAICTTDFVPTDMRGNPDKVLAAILTGRELGIGPMAALQGIRIQDGKPAYDAELMRALVRRRGHEIKATEKTHQRCTVWGRRRDTGEEAEVTWTLEDASIANLIDEIQKSGLPKARSKNGYPMPWEQYPRRMLFARATSELVADLFADVLVGGSYTPEELGTPADWDEPKDPEADARRVESARLVGLIDLAIEEGTVTGEQAQKAATAHGLRTRKDVVAASPDVLQSVVDTLKLEPDLTGAAPAADAPPEGQEGAQGAATGPAEDPGDQPALSARVRAARDALAWEPTDEERQASGDPVEERRTLIDAAAKSIEVLGLDEAGARKILGLKGRKETPRTLAEARLEELRAAVELLETEERSGDEDAPLEAPPTG